MKLPTIYEQSELGMLPADWRVASLRELGQPKIGLTYKPSDVREHGTLVLRSSNVQDGRLHFEDNVFVDPEVAASAHVEDGDILICVRNGSRALIGKCAQINEQGAGMAFGAFMSVYRSEYSDFVFFQFQSDGMKRQIEQHLGATINQITNASLNSFKIPFTDDPEERDAITSTLKDIDDLIASLDALIAKKRDIRQAAMQQLLTGKTRLTGFQGEWIDKRIGSFCTVYSGGTPSTSVKAYYGGSIPWITSSNVNQGRVKSVDAYLTDLGLSHSSAKMVSAGTLLLALYGATAGIPAISDIDAAINQAVLAIIPDDADTAFLYYLFALKRDAIINKLTQGGQPNLSGALVRGLEISMPQTLDEQNAISQTLFDIDLEISKFVEKRGKLNMVRQGMMQQLLTGRIRLV